MVTAFVKRAFSSGQYTHVSVLPGVATAYHPPITATPIFITIDGALPDGLRLRYPLVVQIEEDEGEVLVSEPHFYIHASAPAIADAITEFKRILVDEFKALTADEHKLGSRLRAQLKYLENVIRTA